MFTTLRREPREGFVSTLQAMCCALRVMDPATSTVCDVLEDAFHRLVQRQIEHTRKAEMVRRSNVQLDNGASATKARACKRSPGLLAAPAAKKRAKEQTLHWFLCSTDVSLSGERSYVLHADDVLHCNYDTATKRCAQLNEGRPRGKRITAMPASTLQVAFTCGVCGLQRIIQ